VHTRSDGPCRWGTIRLPADELSRYVRALSGAEFAVPQFVARWQPPPAARRELRQLHQAAIRNAEIRSGVFIHNFSQRVSAPGASRGITYKRSGGFRGFLGMRLKSPLQTATKKKVDAA
jgi:hypothetical protein